MKGYIRSKCIRFLMALVIITISSFTLLPRSQVAYASAGDWPMYLLGAQRSGFNSSETIINPSTVQNLKLHWAHSVATSISVEPVEVAATGMVYWGSWDGVEHASRQSDGIDAWTANLGTAT